MGLMGRVELEGRQVICDRNSNAVRRIRWSWRDNRTSREEMRRRGGERG